MRFLPISYNTIIVELENLDQTLSLREQLEQKKLSAIKETIPAARTLMVRFDPTQTSQQELIDQLSLYDVSQKVALSDTLVEIPVQYNGEDLREVADYLNISEQEVIKRHTESDYIVAFTGFAPGFAYLTGGDPIFDVSRKKIPRTRIPEGAVGLAGTFSGIYPQPSPGGWQIIGVTDLAMFDLTRNPPALLQPGFRVKFTDKGKHSTKTIKQALPTTKPRPVDKTTTPTFLVRSLAMPVLFQDLGRKRQASQGVSTSGAMDRSSFKTANRIVGNQPETACLEITFGGLQIEALEDTVLALAGADCDISIKTAQGQDILKNSYQPIGIEKGDVIKVLAPRAGMRSYLAVKGGFCIEPVLGSVARDTLANLGPLPIKIGDVLSVKKQPRLTPVLLGEKTAFAMPKAKETITLDVVMGPRTDWFSQSSIELFLNQSWEVSPQSNRIGARLSGEKSLQRRLEKELPSEATALGAIQVPASGQPVMFLADHPLTGGYPVIAVVADYHIDIAGQLPVGCFIRFRAIKPFEELFATQSASGKRTKP